MNQPVITGFDDLTDDERTDVEELWELDDAAYDEEVLAWLRGDDIDPEAARYVFRSAQLAERTLDALGRLIPRLEVDLTKAPRSRKSPVRVGLETSLRRARQERKVLGPYVQRARAEAAASGPRQQAYRVLADLYPRLFSQIRRSLRDGAEPKDLVTELRSAGHGEQTGT